MKTRLQKRLVWLSAAVLVGSMVNITAQPSYAQRGKRTFRRAQFEQPLPSVDVPSPAMEGALMPSINDVIPPSLEGSGSRIAPDISMDQQFVEPQYDEPIVDQYSDQQPIPEAYPIDEPYQDHGYGCQDEGPAPIYSTGTWYRRGRWYSNLEVMFMTRTDPRNRSIVTGAQVFTFENLLKHNFHPGTRLSLGHFLGRDAAGRDHQLEIEFTGLFEWDNRRVLNSSNPLGNGDLIVNYVSQGSFQNAFSALIPSDRQTIEIGTEFNQVALNYKIASRPGRDQLAMQPDGRWVRHGTVSQMRTLLAGIRYVSLNDSFLNTGILQGLTQGSTQVTMLDGATNTTTTVTDFPDDQTNNAIRGSYDVKTNNDMFGMHIGGESVEKYDEWSWGLRGSVGALANFAQRRSVAQSTFRNDTVTAVDIRRRDDNGQALFIDANNVVTPDATTTTGGTTTDNTPLFDTTTTTVANYDIATLASNVSDEQFVFAADAGLFATYQLRPNLHFKVSYNMTYLSGLTLAPENLQFSNDFPQLNVNGSTLIHGGGVAFETTW